MELAPVAKRDMQITAQVILPMQQTQKSVSYNTGSKTRYCCMANICVIPRHVIVISSDSIIETIVL